IVLEDPAVGRKYPGADNILVHKLVLVFDDASLGDLRHGKGLDGKLESPALKDGLLKHFPVEINNRSVRANGSRFQVSHLYQDVENWNFYIRILLAFGVEDLDACIDELRLRVVIDIVAMVQDYRRSSGIAGNLFKRQILRRDGQPVFRSRKRQRRRT